MRLERFMTKLGEWYERAQSPSRDPCAKMPAFYKLVAWIAEGRTLAPSEQAHVESCDRCRRTVDAIRREVASIEQVLDGECTTQATGSPAPRQCPRGAVDVDRARPQMRRWGRYAAAACLLLAAAALWLLPGGQAHAYDLREIGYATPIPIAGSWVDFSNPEMVQEVEQTIAEARAKRDEELEKNAALEENERVWLPWTQLYRHQQTLGRWDEALAEMEAFRDYARHRDEQPDRYSPYYVCLFDLGKYYKELGDYETAISFHQQSLEVARDHTLWMRVNEQIRGDRPHQFAVSMTSTLSPRLYALAMLSSASGDRVAAWEYQGQAVAMLLEVFEAECEYQDVSLEDIDGLAPGMLQGDSATDIKLERDSAAKTPPAYDPDGVEVLNERLFRFSRLVADAVEATSAASEQGDTGSEEVGSLPEAIVDGTLHSLFAKVREHFYLAAVLFRVDRDLNAAERMLDLIESMPVYDFAEQVRLDFLVPTEHMRIAIARGDYAAALRFANVAEQHAGSRSWPGRPTHEPIGIITRAELTFLRGVALAGLGEDEPHGMTNAVRLIESAIDAVRESALSITKEERKRFVDRLEDWSNVTRGLRQDPASPVR